MAMTDEKMIQSVKERLGEPQIKVELDDSQWKNALRLSKKWFLAKKGIMGSKALPVSAGGAYTEAQIDSVYGVESILDMYFEMSAEMATFFNDCIFGVFTSGFPVTTSSVYGGPSGMSLGRFTQLMQLYEQRSRIVATEWDFSEVPSMNGQITIMVDGPQGRTVNALFKYKPRLEPEQVDLAWLRQRELDLVERYMMAEAMYSLAHIRSKYSTYDTPGGTVTMNGESLFTMSKDEKELLNKEISDSQGPMGWITG